MRYLYQPMSVMLEMLSTVFPIDDTSVGGVVEVSASVAGCVGDRGWVVAVMVQ